MEGLIPLLIRAVKRQRPQHTYRCLSENSTGRSYHLLLTGDSTDDGSDFHQPDYSAAPPYNADNGLRLRGFSAAVIYGQVSSHGR